MTSDRAGVASSDAATPPAALKALLSSDWDPAFLTPDLPIEESGAWAHLPFLFWLAAAMRPRRMAGLGLRPGVAYLGACAALAEIEAKVEAFGVDAALGDDPRLTATKAFHDRRFSAFSTLCRDQADAPAGLIDLLIVDGVDAATLAPWRARLAPNALVAILGAAPELNGAQIRFDHGEGLTLVAPVGAAEGGKTLLDDLRALGADDAERLRRRFALLGALWSERAIAFALTRQFQDDLNRLAPPQVHVRLPMHKRLALSLKKSWRDPGRHFRRKHRSTNG